MRLTVTLVLITCAALAKTPDLKSVSGYPKMVQKQVTGWIERAAEKMPEEEYAFKPDPASRSFGQILGHIADADYLFCSTVLGESSPSPGIEKTKTAKADLRAAANETVKALGQERNKLGALWFNASHNLEHYGNLVVYMRLKGIVPPSSDPKQ